MKYNSDVTEISSEADLIKIIVDKLVNDKKKIDKDALNLNAVDWQKFKDLITYHEISPFAYLILKKFDSDLPHYIREFLKNNYYCALIRCQSLWREFMRISQAFEESGITVLPLKGAALLADIYLQHFCRPMTDIDILIKEKSLDEAETILNNLGYKKELYGLKQEYWTRNQCHLSFYKQEAEETLVELHWEIDFKRDNRGILPEFWDRIKEIDSESKSIKTLSPEDTLFSLALHNRRFGKTLSLKNVFDIIILLDKYPGFDWDYVLDKSRKYKIRSTVFFALCQASLLYEISIPECVWEGLNVASWKKMMILGFIKQNTFSIKQSVRNKSLYLKKHFLLYDNLREPVSYILNIPIEQFAKFYGFEAYDKRTNVLYKYRLIYMPYKAVASLITNENKSR